MKIAVPKEIKKHEYRVGLTPNAVREYIRFGHKVKVEKNAGTGAGFMDKDYIEAGAEIEESKENLFDWAEMVIKVKEPLTEEYHLFREGHILFTFLHLAADVGLVKMLIEKKIIGIAYETIELEDGTLPCLEPMSAIAGKLSVQEGAKFLEKEMGGKGVLLGGIPGVRRGKVVIIGAGVAGKNACAIAYGMGADITILDINHRKLEYIQDVFGNGVNTLYSTRENIIEAIKRADVIIGAVLIPGASAPKLIRKEDLSLIEPGSVIVDIAIDQGGCVETSHPTTHDNPVFVVDGVLHYCVANMPGAVPRTSTVGLVNRTLRYGLEIANRGIIPAIIEDKSLRKGVNAYNGFVTHRAVAESVGVEYVAIERLIGNDT